MTWITRLSLAAPILLVASGSTDAGGSCSCSDLIAFGVVPDEDTRLPARSEGLRWVAHVPPDEVPGEPVVIVPEGSADSLEAVFTRPDPEEHPWEWVVAPRGGFQPGQRYAVSSAWYTERRTTRESVESVIEVEVSRSARLPLSGLRLEVGPPTFDTMSVPTYDGSCWRPVEAVTRRVAVRFPAGLGEYASSLSYETRVDGRSWYQPRSMCDVELPGLTGSGSGTDILFAPCDGSATALQEGPHRVSMRIWDFRTGEETVTPEVTVELECPGS